MNRRHLMVAITLASLPICSFPDAFAAESRRAAEERFENEIRPVLMGTCFPCHGGKKVSGGLKVGSREALLKGGDSGPAIVPFDVRGSLLLRAIGHADESLKMPPSKKLADEQVTAIRTWIEQGAPWPEGSSEDGFTPRIPSQDHWAFKPVIPREPPVDPSGWSTHPVDRFIAAGQRAAGVRPVAAAGKRALIRRVTFGLIGLPPTPEEIAGFLEDSSPGSFARVVERLLANPRYGERWGRHWMDVVRYADTAGDNADYPVPEAARYRDYIIAAFNTDKPFNQFIREQLAGDLITQQVSPGTDAEAIVATGFLALSRRYGTAPFELWHLTLEDAIETTGRAFLGLTLRCARCHDHKFDPVTQRDYYSLYGVFASTRFPYAGSEEMITKKFPRMNFVPLAATDRVRSTQQALSKQLNEIESAIKVLERSLKDARGARRAGEGERLKVLRTELQRSTRLGLPFDIPTAYAVSEGEPQDAAIQRGGDSGRPGPVVPRTSSCFGFLKTVSFAAVPERSSGRAQLAQWITRDDHPLTSRVTVNRVWQHHFGRGIVATPSNFGIRGEPPSHPELLDWLTAWFVSHGWSIKDLHRQILLSRTYQLSSDFDQQNALTDPGNRWLWHFQRSRLDAESIRDAMLSVSGQLDRRRPPAHPFPPIETWRWTQHNAFKEVYPSHHRSVFLMTQRLVKHPYMAIFDGPDTNTSTDVRPHSTVPTQALFLMNNPFVEAQASALARRLAREEGDPERRVQLAWEKAWGRPPLPSDIDRARRYLESYSNALATMGTSTQKIELDAWTSLAKILLTSNEFLYVD
jgi:hypothetical protein